MVSGCAAEKVPRKSQVAETGKRDKSTCRAVGQNYNCPLEQSEVAKEWKWKVPGLQRRMWKAHWHTTHRHRGCLPGPRGTGNSTLSAKWKIEQTCDAVSEGQCQSDGSEDRNTLEQFRIHSMCFLMLFPVQLCTQCVLNHQVVPAHPLSSRLKAGLQRRWPERVIEAVRKEKGFMTSWTSPTVTVGRLASRVSGSPKIPPKMPHRDGDRQWLGLTMGSLGADTFPTHALPSTPTAVTAPIRGQPATPWHDGKDCVDYASHAFPGTRTAEGLVGVAWRVGIFKGLSTL
ncbi:hypothetical protein B0T20DRAFT_392764 [Sordaria brevicollis]|uniref:Uncharacterized protein n=1 Tax=Sordaria brevicollis TaxID=83679 RepID=A0AAE0PED9_SORBR|nr:hypothetical protein B0T20DRAFT_392764 [Sordaria brevicollis]